MLIVGIVGVLVGSMALVARRNLHWAIRGCLGMVVILGIGAVAWSQRQELDRHERDASEQRDRLCNRAATQLQLLQDRVAHPPPWWPERAALHIWTDGAAPLLDPLLDVCVARPAPCDAYLHYVALLADSASVEGTHRQELLLAIDVIVNAIKARTSCPSPPPRAGNAPK